MKFKIIIIMLILLFSISIVNCDETGTLTFIGEDEMNHPAIPAYAKQSGGVSLTRINMKDISYHNGINFISYKVLDADWSGTSLESDWRQTDYKIGSTTVGTGNCGVNGEDGYKMVYFLFDYTDFTGYSGNQIIDVITHPSISTNKYFNVGYFNTLPDDIIVMRSAGADFLVHDGCVIMHSYEYNYDYAFYDLGNLLNFQLDRDVTKSKLKVKIENENGVFYNETSFLNSAIDCFNVDIDNKSWIVTSEIEIDNSIKYLNYNFPPSIPDTNCRIEVDNIDIGDSINVSYFNIDDLRTNPLKYGDSDYSTCDINIQILLDRGYYDELIYQDMITDENNNIFYYSSEDLTTGIYYAQINKNLGGLNEYAIRKGFKISQPANFSIEINPFNNYIGDNINIIYKSLNQSTISIYDNNSNLIKSWLNIQGDNQKIYKIPIDENYDNAYSNWYIYLNDSGNLSNNLRFNFTVNWKVYVEIEPTPEPTEPYYNVTIEENIKEIKDGLDPLKELIFGFSTIFVDNPDYNKDNIVDVNEISTWLNSLISIAIIIFLYILYKVYKRK